MTEGEAARADLPQVIDHFKESSNRVRYIVFALTTIAILLFTCYLNSRGGNWFEARISTARIARDCLLRMATRSGCAQFSHDELARASSWLAAVYGPLREVSHRDIQKRIEIMESIRSQQVTSVPAPLLGVSFDMNDAGLVGSLSLAILTAVLVFASMRQTENLYLALWRVRRLAEHERDRHSSGLSQSNLLYHALAMTQHFSQPPTLARPISRRWTANLGHMLVLAPITAELLFLIQDFQTLETGRAINGHWADIVIKAECVFSILTLLGVLVYLSCARVNALRWEETFYSINPEYRTKDFVSFPKFIRWHVPRLLAWPIELLAHVDYAMVTERIQELSRWRMKSGRLMARPDAERSMRRKACACKKCQDVAIVPDWRSAPPDDAAEWQRVLSDVVTHHKFSVVIEQGDEGVWQLDVRVKAATQGECRRVGRIVRKALRDAGKRTQLRSVAVLVQCQGDSGRT